MPNLKASIKDLRATKRRTVFNNRFRRRMKGAVKKYTVALDAGDEKAAKELLPRVQEMLDKAAKRGIIKKGTASRRKSRYAQKLNQLSAPNVEATEKNA